MILHCISGVAVLFTFGYCNALLRDCNRHNITYDNGNVVALTLRMVVISVSCLYR